MKYVHLSLGADGETSFADAELGLREADYRPPAPLLFVSRAYQSSALQFVRLPPGWAGKSITVPEPQFLIGLSGSLEITTSDGQVRTLKPGEVVLMEDTTGKGHTSRVVGRSDFVAAVAPITG